MKQAATRAPDQKKLGLELVNRGLIQAESLVEAIRVQQKDGRPLSEILVAMGFVSKESLLTVMGAVLNVPAVDLRQRHIDANVLKYIPEGIARRHHVLPVEYKDNVLLVAMADPGNLQALEDLQAQAGVSIQAALADPTQINLAIDLNYRVTADITRNVQGISGDVEEQPDQAEAPEAADTPLVKTLDLVLLQAIRDRASDIHIEPQPNQLRIRCRIDGVLKESVTLPLSIHQALISRIKILAKMNIAERRLPQDGQFRFKAANKEIDVRVATLDTAHGERAVLRLLDNSTALLGLSDLGFLPDALTRYKAMLRAPHGMILTSGPTGSGKTTTMYSSLNSMDQKQRNIVTIEDPVEYKFAEVNQIQVNAKAGLTFASGLRAILRHDPDVILVGEIRDGETAQIAMQAALTGHLVLSTIHANDCEGVIYRLKNLGVDQSLMASSIQGVISQAMIRRVCPNCAEMRKASDEECEMFARELHREKTEFMFGKGCQFCGGTGYRGRTGVYELMAFTPAVRKMIGANIESGAIKEQAMKEGMATLLQSAFAKAEQGITTPTEVLRTLLY